MLLTKTYLEVINLPTFLERFNYLKLRGSVGESTFGSKRYLNQLLYKMPQWRQTRNRVIIRDKGCDLAHSDFELGPQPAYIHHINPITVDDVLNKDPKVFDMNNLITVSFNTHQAIHYGDKDLLPLLPPDRKPNDTCPWKG